MLSLMVVAMVLLMPLSSPSLLLMAINVRVAVANPEDISINLKDRTYMVYVDQSDHHTQLPESSRWPKDGKG